MTLLEIVQNILARLDSDEVNSISDSVESRQVAQIVKNAYLNIIARADLPEHKKMFTLSASGDADLPVLMFKPTDVLKIEWIKYEKSEDADEPAFDYVTVLPNQQFIDYIHSLNLEDTEVDSMEVDGITYYFNNDAAPQYCTVIQDSNIIFDAYNSDVESTLQASKTLCFGQIAPSFSLSNSFEPSLDENQVPLLINEATALAFMELKQVPNQSAEREARRQWVSLQRNKHLEKQNWFDQLPNYGRK